MLVSPGKRRTMVLGLRHWLLSDMPLGTRRIQGCTNWGGTALPRKDTEWEGPGIGDQSDSEKCSKNQEVMAEPHTSEVWERLEERSGLEDGGRWRGRHLELMLRVNSL
ncbi:hypothetical protein ACRRTK_015496 [Alexandromys fortis]